MSTLNDSPPDENPQGDSSAARQPPRLGIRHLMLWTAMTAVVLGMQRVASYRSPMQNEYVLFYGILWPMLTGGQLAGLIILTAWRYRRLSFSLQPGEWLLLVTGLSSTVTLLLSWPLVIFFDTVGSEGWTAYLYVYGWLMAVFLCGIDFLPAWKVRDSRPWRVFFWIIFIRIVLGTLLRLTALLSPMMLAETFLRAISFYILPYAPVVILGVVLWTDHRARRNWRWTHWVGIGLYLATTLLKVISTMWFRFFPPF